jgi:hypothetical protein
VAVLFLTVKRQLLNLCTFYLVPFLTRNRFLYFNRFLHHQGVRRAFFAAKTAADAGLGVFQIGEGVNAFIARQLRQSQTPDRAGVNADGTGHAGLHDQLGLEPFRSFGHLASGASGIEQRGLRTHPAASAAFDAQRPVNRMEFLLFAGNGPGGAKTHAGAATIAFFGNCVGHILPLI